MKALVAAKPTVKTVFTGWGGRDWLYHYRRVGTRGVITQRPMYADLLVKIWRALEGGSRPVATETADALFHPCCGICQHGNILPASVLQDRKQAFI